MQGQVADKTPRSCTICRCIGSAFLFLMWTEHSSWRTLKTHLRNVHAPGWLETIVGYGIRLVGQQLPELVLLSDLFSERPDQRDFFIHVQPASTASREPLHLATHKALEPCSRATCLTARASGVAVHGSSHRRRCWSKSTVAGMHTRPSGRKLVRCRPQGLTRRQWPCWRMGSPFFFTSFFVHSWKVLSKGALSKGHGGMCLQGCVTRHVLQCTVA